MNLLIQAAVAFAIALAAFFWRRAKKASVTASGGNKRALFLPTALLICSLWFATGRLLGALLPSKGEGLHVEIFPGKLNVFGLSISSSIAYTWGLMAGVLLLAVLFRLFVVPRFRDVPRGLQNLVEGSIEAVDRFTRGQLHVATDALACYMFTLVILIMGADVVELLGYRPPTADLVMTLSMGLVTFILINYYSIKEKGVRGRVKDLASPTPFIMPVRILVDFATPVSLACRLFGNILGGMIVIDLLKYALGAFGVGLTPLAGLYFNVFHPLIQTYIFITLSLTFINEAVE
jgi:F-type H+-transporting ATPase subunit a